LTSSTKTACRKRLWEFRHISRTKTGFCPDWPSPIFALILSADMKNNP
jgi:hypothetical protein